ncbi:unnamed protein product [Pipistrellus nathusii]|uniref:Uncharacterized protein n=1 Tax=Pipistrellus nathusii TaxID=59473 RepID=A0ABN9ZQ80_PIPNA
MHQFRKEGLNPAWEKPAKTERAKRFIFSSLICYTDHNQRRPPNAHEYISTNTILVLTARSVVEGKTAAYPGTRKPEKTALHANNHSEPLSATQHDLSRF